MGRDGEQLATASKRFDLLTGDPGIDPEPVGRTDDLQAIADAAAAVAVAEDRLKAAVEAARAQGRSWRQIGQMLGMSRQAARDSFGQQTNAKRKASRARRVMRQETAVLDRLALNQSQNGTAKHVPDDGQAEQTQAKKVRRPH
jgi:hypothetical protein